jgi:hypothetical protein
MKKLTIKITAELDIPDDWELVDHEAGMQVLKVGDRYVEFDITPLATDKNDAEAMWTDEDEKLTNEILESISEFDSEMTITLRH